MFSLNPSVEGKAYALNTGPSVSLVAGSGLSAATNGPTDVASFIEPAGLAIDRSGTIYVADAGAQQIRRIKDGVVTTIAGSAVPGPDPQEMVGGYVDGATDVARFRRPLGIAVARTGVLFVADSANSCIRQISNGTVRTFAGSTESGDADGLGSASRFARPKALAIDDDGNLYVADYGNGLRKVTPSGEVTTINHDRRILGVAARYGGKQLILAWTNFDEIHFTSPLHGETVVKAHDQREPYLDQDLLAGRAYGIAIAGPDSVVVTDLQRNAVKLVRMPFETGVEGMVLAGGLNEATNATGGYANGAAAGALLNAPMGIGVSADGTILFSDSGNRRIRRISGVDVRGPIDVSDPKAFIAPPNTYRVAVVGNSVVFHNVLWPQSIPGKIEESLRQAGLRKAPYVTCIRVNAASIKVLRSVIDNHLSDGEADLVLLVVDLFVRESALSSHPELRKDARWKVEDVSDLRAINAALAKSNTRFMVVYLPAARSVFGLEGAAESAGADALLDTPLAARGDRIPDLEIETAWASAGTRFLSLRDSMVAYERSANHLPLYYTRDIHPSPEGQAFAGDEIARELARWHPWR
jgi:DNA-binding beta-propeller fold protein YncE